MHCKGTESVISTGIKLWCLGEIPYFRSHKSESAHFQEKPEQMNAYLKQYPSYFQLMVFIGLYLGCTLIYYFVFMGWGMPHFTGITAFELQNGYQNNPKVLDVMKWMQLFYSIVSFLIPAWLFFYLSDPQPYRFGHLAKAPFQWAGLLASVIILLFSLPLVGVLSDWNQLIHFGSLDQSLRELNQKAQDVTQAMLQMPSWGSLVYNLMLIAVIPAIAEEMFFRGVLQRLFVRMSKRAWIGILIAAIVFSLLHGEMLGFFPRVALGIILGLIYYYSNNLWYAIGAHFFNNAFQIVLVFLFQKHYIRYDISQNEPTPVVAGLISLVIVIGLFVVYKKYFTQRNVPGIWAKQRTIQRVDDE